jgi:hypothetical protein
MRAFFAENSAIKRDEIAIRRLVVLNEYLGRRQKPLGVTNVKEMFLQMRDQRERFFPEFQNRISVSLESDSAKRRYAR